MVKEQGLPLVEVSPGELIGALAVQLRPLLAQRRISPVESLSQMGQRLLRDPPAGIQHLHPDAVLQHIGLKL